MFFSCKKQDLQLNNSTKQENSTVTTSAKSLVNADGVNTIQSVIYRNIFIVTGTVQIKIISIIISHFYIYKLYELLILMFVKKIKHELQILFPKTHFNRKVHREQMG